MFCLWTLELCEHFVSISKHTNARGRVQSRTGAGQAGRAGRPGGGAIVECYSGRLGELASHFFLNSGQTSFVYNLHCKDSAILPTGQSNGLYKL